jgi:hypothetical protein
MKPGSFFPRLNSFATAGSRIGLALLIGIALNSCGGKKTTEKNPLPGQGKQPAKVAGTGQEAEQTSSSTVKRVVFVDQQEACDCTQERQVKSWNNLQAALAGMESPPIVEVVHFDTQAEDAQMYLDLKPIMVSPGIYFFDGKEELIEGLQGEVTSVQVTTILQK